MRIVADTTRNNVRSTKANRAAFPEEIVMKVTGGCHCGHITYEAEADPATASGGHPGAENGDREDLPAK
jgi:hypothetical protein